MNEKIANLTGEGQPSGSVCFVFVTTGADESIPAGSLKLYMRSEDLPSVFGSEKLAKILAKNCLTPVIRSASRLTLYWVGDVVEVADRLRRGEIVVDLAAATVTKKS